MYATSAGLQARSPHVTSSRLRFTFAALSFAAAAAAQDPGAPAAPVPPSYGKAPSMIVPYAEKVDFHHLDKLLKVHASINGGPVGEFVVDTGSVGIVVTADDVPNIDAKAVPSTFTYSSSGREMHGFWTVATVTFTDARGGDASAVVPVFAVKSEQCTGGGVNASSCRPTDHPHTHMMGVGFGREQNAGRPDKNPFLNLKDMQNGSMHRGYVIGRQGFTLGLTDSLLTPGFVWQKLHSKPVAPETTAASPALRDWETAPGSFRLKDVQSGPGTILIDTGLTNMMLAMPGNKGEIPDGLPITIDLLGGQVHYTFNSGDERDPQSPRKVNWVKPTHGVFVNTGLRALAYFEYLFDAENGWLALRRMAP